ncbi:hypothetical protein C0995_008174 [Termitomyces sp. Mi166|nr:hypothetical protein C0995_008174 [Termitomyces sp. Mi166\
MPNEIKRPLKGQFSEAMIGLMSKGTLYDYNQSDPEPAYDRSTLYQVHPPMSSQQLINDLAELRENATIISRNPAEEARSRIMRPFFEPGASLPWPPIYPPAPLKYDFYADHYSEESSSPSLSSTSELSDLVNWNAHASVAGSSVFLRSPTHPQSCPGSSAHHSPAFQPKAPSPSPRILPHIIGEDDPFNPFSYDLFFEDKNVRSIDTPEGRIFAPVPKLPTAAALANFEIIALAAMVPAVEEVVEKEPFTNKDCYGMFPNEKNSGSMSSRKEAAPPSKENFSASLAPIQQSNVEHGDVLYETGPKPQVKLVREMMALLSLEPGPLEDEKMKQLWGSNGQDASGSSSGKPASEMTGNEVYEGLVPVAPQPPKFYPTNRQHLSLLRILSKDY